MAERKSKMTAWQQRYSLSHRLPTDDDSENVQARPFIVAVDEVHLLCTKNC